MDKNFINNLSSIDSELEKGVSIENILNYDNELEVINNIPHSVYNLINWKELNEEKSKFKNDRLLISDLNLSISHIEDIINFKFDMINIVAKKYGVKGLNLVFKGKYESLLFNTLFRAINKNTYRKDRSIKYNLNKMCIREFLRVKDEFLSTEDILHLNEFLKIRKELKSGLLDKSIKLLEYGFIDLLNGKDINWQEIREENIKI